MEVNNKESTEYLNRIKKQNKLLKLVLLLLVVVYIVLVVSYDNCNGESDYHMSPFIEQDSFNSMFTIYKGEQKGSKVKSLLGTLIANANTYREDTKRVPELIVKSNGLITNYAERPDGSDEKLDMYIKNIADVRNALDNKGSYWIEFSYYENMAIDKIIITGKLSK